MYLDEMRDILVTKELKVTPQRIAVLEALSALKKHPTADTIIEFIRKNHPNIASGTVYNTLETFVEKGIIQRVKTDKDIMRYDHIMEKHHHLYDNESDRIEDYFDNELDEMLYDHFAKKNIPDFEIQDIKLQIKGKFNKI